jgi:transcriptional regulator with XRE-family HTH domain
VSDADDERQQSIRTYANRGIPLPGLRLARQRLDLTQHQLAFRAGTGQHTMSKLERLERRSYPRTLQKLAAALGVSPAELVGDRGDE